MTSAPSPLISVWTTSSVGAVAAGNDDARASVRRPHDRRQAERVVVDERALGAGKVHLLQVDDRHRGFVFAQTEAGGRLGLDVARLEGDHDAAAFRRALERRLERRNGLRPAGGRRHAGQIAVVRRRIRHLAGLAAHDLQIEHDGLVGCRQSGPCPVFEVGERGAVDVEGRAHADVGLTADVARDRHQIGCRRVGGGTGAVVVTGRQRAAGETDRGESEDGEDSGDLAHRNSLGGSVRLTRPTGGLACAVRGALGFADALAQVLVGDLPIAHRAGRPQFDVFVAVARLRGAPLLLGGMAPGASRRAQMRKPVWATMR